MRLIVLALLLAGTACATAPSATTGDRPAEEASTTPSETAADEAAAAPACDAAPAQHLIGRKRSAELGEEAQRLSGARALRWIPPDTMVTMDYRTDRLNIALDREDKVN